MIAVAGRTGIADLSQNFALGQRHRRVAVFRISVVVGVIVVLHFRVELAQMRIKRETCVAMLDDNQVAKLRMKIDLVE